MTAWILWVGGRNSTFRFLKPSGLTTHPGWLPAETCDLCLPHKGLFWSLGRFFSTTHQWPNGSDHARCWGGGGGRWRRHIRVTSLSACGLDQIHLGTHRVQGACAEYGPWGSWGVGLAVFGQPAQPEVALSRENSRDHDPIPGEFVVPGSRSRQFSGCRDHTCGGPGDPGCNL